MASKFGGIPVDEQPSGSRFGGIPVAAAPTGAEQSGLSRFGQGFWQNTGGALINTGAAAVDLIKQEAIHPGYIEPNSRAGKTIQGIVDAQVDQAKKAKTWWDRGEHVEALGHALAAVVPLIGPAAAEAGETIGEGDYAGGAGKAAGLLTSVLGPKAVETAARTPAVRAGSAYMRAAAPDVAIGTTKAALGLALAKYGPLGELADALAGVKLGEGALKQVGRGLKKGRTAAGEAYDAAQAERTPAPAATPEPAPAASSEAYYAEQPGGSNVPQTPESEAYYASQQGAPEAAAATPEAAPATAPEIQPGMSPADLARAVRAMLERKRAAAAAAAPPPEPPVTEPGPAAAEAVPVTEPAVQPAAPAGWAVRELRTGAPEAPIAAPETPAEAPGTPTGTMMSRAPAETQRIVDAAMERAFPAAPEPDYTAELIKQEAERAAAAAAPEITPGMTPADLAAEGKRAVDARSADIAASKRARPGGPADTISKLLNESGMTLEQIDAMDPAAQKAFWKNAGGLHRNKYDPSPDTIALIRERMGALEGGKAPVVAEAPPAPSHVETVAKQLLDAGITSEILEGHPPELYEKYGIAPNEFGALKDALKSVENYRYGQIGATVEPASLSERLGTAAVAEPAMQAETAGAPAAPETTPTTEPTPVRATKTTKPLVGKDPATMTSGEINKALDRVDDLFSKLTQEFIEAGRGSERPSEIFQKTDPLAERYKAAVEAQRSLRDEIGARYGPNHPSRLPPGFKARKRA